MDIDIGQTWRDPLGNRWHVIGFPPLDPSYVTVEDGSGFRCTFRRTEFERMNRC